MNQFIQSQGLDSYYDNATGTMKSFKEEAAKRRQAFLNDCARATIVETTRGKAILIGMSVIDVSSHNEDHIEWLVDALRSTRQTEGA